jgi:hypothetical protein
MRLKMSLTLCGIGIPYEEQNEDRCAASRIHASAQIDYTPYAGDDLAGALRAVHDSALGIINGIDQGVTVNLQGGIVTKSKQIEELTTLVADLQTIAQVVQTSLATPEGNARWSGGTVQCWNEIVSLPAKCVEFLAAATQMQTRITLVQQQIDLQRALIADEVDQVMVASASEPVPRDIATLVAQFVEIE